MGASVTAWQWNAEEEIPSGELGKESWGTQAVNRCCQGLRELSSGERTFETDLGILWILSCGPQGTTPCILIKIWPNCELTALVCKTTFKGCTME